MATCWHQQTDDGRTAALGLRLASSWIGRLPDHWREGELWSSARCGRSRQAAGVRAAERAIERSRASSAVKPLDQRQAAASFRRAAWGCLRPGHEHGACGPLRHLPRNASSSDPSAATPGARAGGTAASWLDGRRPGGRARAGPVVAGRSRQPSAVLASPSPNRFFGFVLPCAGFPLRSGGSLPPALRRLRRRSLHPARCLPCSDRLLGLSSRSGALRLHDLASPAHLPRADRFGFGQGRSTRPKPPRGPPVPRAAKAEGLCLLEAQPSSGATTQPARARGFGRRPRRRRRGRAALFDHDLLGPYRG